MIARQLILKSAGRPGMERFVRTSRLFRPIVKRFIAGDTLEEAMSSAQELLDAGFKVSLDLLGENTSHEKESLAAVDQYSTMLRRIGQTEGATQGPAGYKQGATENLNISIKLTQCGLDQGDEFCINNLLKVLALAESYNNFVRVDMEGSAYTARTLDLVAQAYAAHQNVGTVLQSYLLRTNEDLERMMKLGCRLRLVKGAYLEPATVAYPNKSDVDAAYVRQAHRMLEAANYPAFATHDEKIIEQILHEVQSNGHDKARFEFQMLYGIRRDLQQRLLKEGYNVRVYVPFGDGWYPYFTRRLAERPANALFILKALFGKG